MIGTLTRAALHLSFKCDLRFCHHDGSIMPHHAESTIEDLNHRTQKPRELLFSDQDQQSNPRALALGFWL